MGDGMRLKPAERLALGKLSTLAPDRRAKPLLQSELARELGWGASKLSRLLGSLEGRGLVERWLIGGNKNVALSAKGRAWVLQHVLTPAEKTLEPSYMMDRCHATTWRVPHAGLALLPKDATLERGGFVLVEGWRNNRKWTQKHVTDDVSIQITSQSVLLHVGETPARSPFEALKQSFEKAMKALDALLKKVPGFKLGDSGLAPDDEDTRLLMARAQPQFVQLANQHHALVDDPISRLFLGNGVRLEVRDENGEVRLIADKSTGVPEVEAVHPVHAADDISRVQEDLLAPALRGEFQGVPRLVPQMRLVEESQRVLYENLATMSEVARVQTEVAERRELFTIIREQREELRHKDADLRDAQEQMKGLKKEMEDLRKLVEGMQQRRNAAFAPMGSRDYDPSIQ